MLFIPTVTVKNGVSKITWTENTFQQNQKNKNIYHHFKNARLALAHLGEASHSEMSWDELEKLIVKYFERPNQFIPRENITFQAKIGTLFVKKR